MVIYSNAAPLDVGQRLHGAIGLLQQGRLEEAWQALADVLAADPANALAYQLRALILVQVGQTPAAVEDLRRSIALDPADATAHSNLASALREVGAYEEALGWSDRAIALAPGLADAHLNRGNALLDLGRPEDAIACYDQALARQPGQAKAYNNRGNALRSLNRAAEAVEDFERAIALDPDTAEIRANCGFAHLALGDLPKGLALFEWRWKNRSMQAYLQGRGFRQPFWRGQEPLAGKAILLHSEQGFGDVLQFCRYAALASEAGARVVVEVDPALAPLMRSLTGADAVVAQGEPLPAFDLHCPMMSLPFAFGTTLQTIPARTPYLRADPAKVAEWRARLGPATRPRVGLVWSSGVRPDQPELRSVNGRRNIPLAALAALKGAPVQLHSLQKGEPAEGEFRALDQAAWDGPQIVDTARDIRDFSDTAAVMEILDLVVSVDTSVPHLAGALGRPVWVMNRFDPCWRWLQDRTDSPWYPTARLFRQPAMGDWDSVLAEVGRELEVRFGGGR
jgi:tetratricopeptide (TPR) repeat protein